MVLLNLETLARHQMSGFRMFWMWRRGFDRANVLTAGFGTNVLRTKRTFGALVRRLQSEFACACACAAAVSVTRLAEGDNPKQEEEE